MLKPLAIAALTLLALTASLRADVMLDFRIAKAAATTRPAADDSTLSVLAVPGHDFCAKYSDDDRSVKVSGSVRAIRNGKYQVHIEFDQRDRGQQLVSTTADLKPGEVFELARLDLGIGPTGPAVTLTLEPVPTQ